MMFCFLWNNGWLIMCLSPQEAVKKDQSLLSFPSQLGHVGSASRSVFFFPPKSISYCYLVCMIIVNDNNTSNTLLKQQNTQLSAKDAWLTVGYDGHYLSCWTFWPFSHFDWWLQLGAKRWLSLWDSQFLHPCSCILAAFFADFNSCWLE